MWILHKLLAKKADDVEIIIVFDNILVGTDSFDNLSETMVASSRSSQKVQMFLAAFGISSKPITCTRIFTIEQLPPSLDVLLNIYAVIFDIIVFLLLKEAVFKIVVFFIQILFIFLLIR